MSKYTCPICGQYMDFIVTSHKSKPFIDGKLYPKMCFCCFHVPAQYVITYTKDGLIESEEGPFYSHRYMKTPEELFEDQTAGSLHEAEKCVQAVRRLCRAIGVKALDKLKLVRPKAEYEANPEYDAGQRARWQRKAGKRKFKWES